MGFKKCFLYRQFGEQHAGRDCPEYINEDFGHKKGCKFLRECMGFRDFGYVVCDNGTWKVCPKRLPDYFNSHIGACYGCHPQPKEYPGHPKYKEEAEKPEETESTPVTKTVTIRSSYPIGKILCIGLVVAFVITVLSKIIF